uniref:Xylanolytic transcriptional activator regulatory domain-containing protein n=1 Tax=Mycena chlorophos TaxID=658473 RepID=A0ABQ0KWT2_MYCCL|nr:predicted protein [Mycena chlorophos]
MPQAAKKEISAQRQADKESKRARGALSCAECRRLKLNCKRRGCAAICPNGSLITGQGTRFVLADTEKLHQKIATMSDRIRHLEDALAVLQSTVSTDQHPLLTRELLKIKSSIELHAAIDDVDGDTSAIVPEGDEQDNPEEYIDAFGTLAIREDGAATFYGRSAGSESLLAGEAPQSSPLSSPSIPSGLSSIASMLGPSVLRRQDNEPPSISSFASSFPFGDSGAASGIDLDYLVSQLPAFPETFRLCELYLSQAPWFFGAVARSQISDELLPLWFPDDAPRPASAPTVAGGGGRGLSPPPVGTAHDLALLFMVLAFGAAGDTTMPFPAASPDPSFSADDLRPDSRGGYDARHYYSLTKAALTLEPVLEGPPSVATVQTLALMAIYEGIRAGENSIENTWAIFGLSTKLAQSIGLHRDCARWGLKPAEVQKRRALFWELFITDCWQALATGRLPTFSLPFVDCELPQDVDEVFSDHGKPQSSFPYWKARFGAECVAAVVQGTLTSRAPRYSIILELDRKVRDLEFPKYATGPAPEGAGLSQTMSHFMPTNYRHLTLLYIHRCFFAHAIQNHPNDPIKSPYAPSFLAGYRSACDLLTSLRQQFNTFPAEIARYWVLWTHAFSSSIMLSSVVTHATRSKVAQAALLELGKACELFEAAAQICPGSRASKFLPILQRVSKRAVSVFEDAVNGAPATIPNNIFEPSKPDATADELAIFSGKTHTLTTVKKKAQPQNAPSPPSSRAMSDSPSQATTDNPSFAGVHPNLVKELNVFDGTLNAQIQNGFHSNGMYSQQVFGHSPPTAQQPYEDITYPFQQHVLREQQDEYRQRQNEEMLYRQQQQQQQQHYTQPPPAGYESYVPSPISPTHSQDTPFIHHSSSQQSLRQASYPPPPQRTPPQQHVHQHQQQDVPMPGPSRSLSHSQSRRSLRQHSYEAPPPLAPENGHGLGHVLTMQQQDGRWYEQPRGGWEVQSPVTPRGYHGGHQMMEQHQQQLRSNTLQIDPGYEQYHYTPDGAMRGIAAEDPRLQEHWQIYMSKVGSPRMIQDP